MVGWRWAEDPHTLEDLQRDWRTLGNNQNSASWAEICNHIVTHQMDRSPCGFSHQLKRKRLGWLGERGGNAGGDLEGTLRDRQHPWERRQRPHPGAALAPSPRWQPGSRRVGGSTLEAP